MSFSVIAEVYSLTGLSVDSLDDEGVGRVALAADAHRKEQTPIKLDINITFTKGFGMVNVATVGSGLVAPDVLGKVVNAAEVKAGG